MISYRHGLRVGRLLLDALLPPQCLTCEAAVTEQGQFCAACFVAIGFVTEPCCAACGTPFTHAAQAGRDRLCPTCADCRPQWGRARGALRYDERSRNILLGLKHGDRTEHAAPLARLMARAGAVLLREADLLVPVPLPRRRLIARRYNQSVLLARAVGRLAGRPMLPDALCRIRATPMLGELSADARAAAVAGAFAVPPRRRSAIAGRRILLIDDVLTSGATAAACTRALLAAGAMGVDVLVAARVPDPRLA
jgi:predicted amidophosphoribosyltransferase